MDCSDTLGWSATVIFPSIGLVREVYEGEPNKQDGGYDDHYRAVALHAYYNVSLWELEIGEWIIFDGAWYKVMVIKIVEPTDVFVYNDTYDLMVITCINPFKWDKRMIFEAVFWDGARIEP